LISPHGKTFRARFLVFSKLPSLERACRGKTTSPKVASVAASVIRSNHEFQIAQVVIIKFFPVF
jgi:hypothetical protein